MKPPTATMTMAPKIQPKTAPQMTPGKNPNGKHFNKRCSPTTGRVLEPERKGVRGCHVLRYTHTAFNAFGPAISPGI